LVGHGVPTGLLHQLCDAAKGWLGMRQQQQQQQQTKDKARHSNDDDDDAQQQEQQSKQYDQISFTNIPNTTLLDTERIYCTMSSNPQLSINNDDTNNYSDDTTTTSSPTTTPSQEVQRLSSLPTEWDYDIEMYMVVMDRIASRMASIAIMAHPPTHKNSIGITDGSIIVTPSQLNQYNVTITRGSATFLLYDNIISSSSSVSTTPTALARRSVGNDRWKNQRRRRSLDNNSNEDTAVDAGDLSPPPPTLTLEYVHKSNGSANQTISDDSDNDDDCCWKVILTLQNHQPMGKCKHQATTNTSVSLIFEGEYVLPA
jgi:hypothetical protein